MMDDYQPSAVSHSAPQRFTQPSTTRHENQSLFIFLSLAYSFFLSLCYLSIYFSRWLLPSSIILSFFFSFLFPSTSKRLGEHRISMQPINCTRSLRGSAEQPETCFGCGYKWCTSMTSLLSLLALKFPGMPKPGVCASKCCNYNTRKGATVGNCALKIVIALLS